MRSHRLHSRSPFQPRYLRSLQLEAVAAYNKRGNDIQEDTMSVRLEDAKRVIAAAEKKAVTERERPVVASVSGGKVVAIRPAEPGDRR